MIESVAKSCNIPFPLEVLKNNILPGKEEPYEDHPSTGSRAAERGTEGESAQEPGNFLVPERVLNIKILQS